MTTLQPSSYPVQFIINKNGHEVTSSIKYLNNCTLNELLIAAKSELSQYEIQNNEIVFQDYDDVYMDTNTDVEDAFDGDDYTEYKPLRLKLLFKPKTTNSDQIRSVSECEQFKSFEYNSNELRY